MTWDPRDRQAEEGFRLPTTAAELAMLNVFSVVRAALESHQVCFVRGDDCLVSLSRLDEENAVAVIRGADGSLSHRIEVFAEDISVRRWEDIEPRAMRDYEMLNDALRGVVDPDSQKVDDSRLESFASFSIRTMNAILGDFKVKRIAVEGGQSDAEIILGAPCDLVSVRRVPGAFILSRESGAGDLIKAQS